jgi:hypothetical protein
MKADTVVNVLAIGAACVAAWWTYKQFARSSSSTPPASQQYHARNAPYGFTWSPAQGAWTRTTPNGTTEYYV